MADTAQSPSRKVNWLTVGNVLGAFVSALTVITLSVGPLRATLTMPKEVEKLGERMDAEEVRSIRHETELTELRLESRQEVRVAAEKFKRIDEKLVEQTDLLREVNRKLDGGRGYESQR